MGSYSMIVMRGRAEHCSTAYLALQHTNTNTHTMIIDDDPQEV
jgi:hypothetical protein